MHWYWKVASSLEICQSLYFILCKVYENILRDGILFFVESKISPDQTMDSVMERIEEGIPVEILFLILERRLIECLTID